MTTIVLPEDVAARLQLMADLRGEDANVFAVAAIRTALQSLSYKEQERLLASEAERLAAVYEADLALPTHERELTAFTVLDGVDPVREPTEYLYGNAD